MKFPSIVIVVTASMALAGNVGKADWIVYEEDFDGLNGGDWYVSAESALGDEWELHSTNEGRTRIFDWGGSHGGVLVLDDSTGNNIYSLNEAILTVDLLGYTDITLHFDHYDSFDEEHAIGTASYVDHKNADGVAVSSDGTNWYPLVNFSQADFTWESYWGSISDLVDTVPELELSDTFQIKFQQYDNYFHGLDARTFDNIVVKAEEQAHMPEPASATLFGIGLAGLAFSRCRRRS